MADIDSQRAHLFPEDSFPRPVPRQQNHHALASHNSGVSLSYHDVLQTAHLSVHNALKMLPTASNAHPESQRMYVPPLFGNRDGAAQSGPSNSQHVNMSDYRVPEYPPLPAVRNYIYIYCMVSVVLLAKSPS